jgi:hypothetical protein
MVQQPPAIAATTCESSAVLSQWCLQMMNGSLQYELDKVQRRDMQRKASEER